MTRNQLLQVLAVVFGACVAASSLWTQLFGADAAQIIISIFGLLNTILAGISYVLTGLTLQVTDTARIPGIDGIAVGQDASAKLAAIALDTIHENIKAASPAAEQALRDKLEGSKP